MIVWFALLARGEKRSMEATRRSPRRHGDNKTPEHTSLYGHMASKAGGYLLLRKSLINCQASGVE